MNVLVIVRVTAGGLQEKKKKGPSRESPANKWPTISPTLGSPRTPARVTTAHQLEVAPTRPSAIVIQLFSSQEMVAMLSSLPVLNIMQIISPPLPRAAPTCDTSAGCCFHVHHGLCAM